MEILNKIKGIVNIFIYIVVLVLLVMIYFKNIRIDNLKDELNKKPIIIEKITRDTFRDSIPIPYEIVKWQDSIIYLDSTIYKPIDLTTADSAKIAQEYGKIFDKYTESKSYSNILRDDSLAFIQLDEKVQYNSIFNRKLTYEHRTPVIKLPAEVKVDYTTSIVGGLSGNFDNIGFEAGLVTKRNIVYTLKYTPEFSKTEPVSKYEATILLPIINF